MRRSVIAVSGASAGAMLAVAGGVPAFAADAPNGPCADFNGHVLTTTPYDDSFYDCVPQYGVGKVEFTVEDPDGLPTDFSLTDTGVTTVDAHATAPGTPYFFSTSLPGFRNINESGSSSTTRDYDGELIYPVVSVTPLDPTTPPADCVTGTETYNLAYRITYAPAVVDFTTTADGTVLKTNLTSAPGPLDLYLNVTTGAFDTNAPQCATNGAATLIAQSSADGEFSIITSTNSIDLSPFPLEFIIPIDPAIFIPAPADLGTLATTDVTPDPALAETGSEVSPGLIGLAGMLLVGGAAAITATRRRTRFDA